MMPEGYGTPGLLDAVSGTVAQVSQAFCFLDSEGKDGMMMLVVRYLLLDQSLVLMMLCGLMRLFGSPGTHLDRIVNLE